MKKLLYEVKQEKLTKDLVKLLNSVDLNPCPMALAISNALGKVDCVSDGLGDVRLHLFLALLQAKFSGGAKRSFGSLG